MPVAAADRELALAARDGAQEAVAVPARRVRKAKARIDVAGVVVEVVNAILDLFRSTDVLITYPEVESEILEETPVVLGVEVLFLEPVLQIVRTEALLKRADAAGHEGMEAARIGHAAARCREVPEPTIAVIGAVIER